MEKHTVIIVVGALILVVLIGVWATSRQSDQPALPSVQRVSPEKFMQTYSQTPGAVLLDVRTPAEFDAGHIAGATNLDFNASSFFDEVQKLDPTKTYFVYCHSGNRSGQATALMHRAGIASIYDLHGGVEGAPQLIGDQ